MLQHNVYFYLKDNLSESEKAKFETGLKSLLNIEDLIEGFVGTPAKTETRPVVDNRYDYALSTVFKDVSQHDTYQSHSTHKKFIETCKDLWKEVKVYDVEIMG